MLGQVFIPHIKAFIIYIFMLTINILNFMRGMYSS